MAFIGSIRASHVALWAAYALCVFILALYYPNHGDESIWAYQALMVNDGMRPGIDFATHEPLGLLWAYGAIYRYISQSQEAIRIVIAVLCIFQNAAIYAIVARLHGRWWAVVALLLATTNFFYMYDIITANSQTLSYAAVMAVYACLVLIPGTGISKYLLSGVFLGVAIATRLPTALVSLVVAGHALWQARCGRTSPGRAVLNVGAAALPAVTLCLPDLLLFLSAPQMMWFERVGLANALYQPTGAQGAWPFLLHGLGVIGEYITLSSRFSFGTNFPVLLGLMIVGGWWGWQRVRCLSAQRMQFPTDLVWAWAMVVALATTYLSTWMSRGSYLTPLTPFLIIITTVSLGRIADGHYPPLRWVRPAVLVVIVPFSMLGAAELSREVLFRQSGGSGQKITTAGLGCWLEIATTPKDLIIDFWPSAVVQADRRMPRGLEKAGQIRQVYALDEKLVRYMPGALTKDEMVGLIDRQEPALVDYGDGLYPSILPGFDAALRKNYDYIGSYGGEISPYRLWASKRWLAARTTPLPALPRDYNTEAHWYSAAKIGYPAFAAALLRDLWHSVRTFPDDVSASIARFVGASWERRCRFVMDGEGGGR